jgi:hypothetical protein
VAILWLVAINSSQSDKVQVDFRGGTEKDFEKIPDNDTLNKPSVGFHPAVEGNQKFSERANLVDGVRMNHFLLQNGTSKKFSSCREPMVPLSPLL